MAQRFEVRKKVRKKRRELEDIIPKKVNILGRA